MYTFNYLYLLHNISCVWKWMNWFNTVLLWFGPLMKVPCGSKHVAMFSVIFLYKDLKNNSWILLVSYRELKHKCLLSRTEVTECKLKELHKRTGASCVSAAGKRSRGPHCLGGGVGTNEDFVLIMTSLGKFAEFHISRTLGYLKATSFPKCWRRQGCILCNINVSSRASCS
jgi:hypothetical protein